jgi:membrane protein implicated in regulation of membrane protease activity
VKAALDEQETARSNAQIDDAIESGARDVEGLCNRPEYAFLPVLATRYFDYPSRSTRSPSWRLWLSPFTLIEATTVTTAGGTVTLTAGQYNPEPVNNPPYTSIEINRGSTGSFDSGSTEQRSTAVAGLWGWSDNTRDVGSLTATLGASAAATASLAWTTARFGVGDILLIDDERMVIRERSFVDSTQNLAADLDADSSDVNVSVADGTAFAVEEIISIDGERMRVVDITGNTLTVKRAWDGSQLAAHTSTADIYALTGVELDRAQLGTALAAHSSGATVSRWIAPPLLASLNRAYALNTLLQERAGYARVAGSGENAREFTGRGIAALEKDVKAIFGIKARLRSIV